MHKSFEILLINISTVRLSRVIQQCDAIGRLLHYTKSSLSSPCTSQHKHEQKDKTKTLVKFPDHVFTEFGSHDLRQLVDNKSAANFQQLRVDCQNLLSIGLLQVVSTSK